MPSAKQCKLLACELDNFGYEAVSERIGYDHTLLVWDRNKFL